MAELGHSLNKSRPTTKAHFKVFVKECEYLLSLLGEVGWDTEFKHEILPGSQATVRWYLEARTCVFTLATSWHSGGLIDDFSIRRCAAEECFHLLFARLDHMARKRTYDESGYDEEEHRVIKTFMRVFWAPACKRREK